MSMYPPVGYWISYRKLCGRRIVKREFITPQSLVRWLRAWRGYVNLIGLWEE